MRVDTWFAPTTMNAPASGGGGEKREERRDRDGVEALLLTASPGNDRLHVCMYVVSRLSPPAGAHNAAA